MSDSARAVTWLHIGDFHIKDGDSYDRDTVLQALVESVREQRERAGRHVDLIFVTGDVAFSGLPSQYESATKFLEELESAAGVSRDRVFVIPGNHDVDRGKGRLLARTLTSNSESQDFFGSDDEVGLFLSRKQGAFRRWHDHFFSGIRKLAEATTCEPLVLLPINGVSVTIAQINSSLFCQGEDDHNKLWVGRRCLAPVLADVRKTAANIRVALIHHPLEWLNDNERSNITASLRDNFDVILRGHLHETDAEVVQGVTGSALHLACGATYQGSQWPNRIMYVTADHDAGTVTIFPMQFEDSPRPIWTTDASTFPREAAYAGILPIRWKSQSNAQLSDTADATHPSKSYLDADTRVKNDYQFETNGVARASTPKQPKGLEAWLSGEFNDKARIATSSPARLLRESNELQRMLISCARGVHVDNTMFVWLRDSILHHSLIKDQVPQFLKDCPTISEFREYIHYEKRTRKERTDFLRVSFKPIFYRLEEFNDDSESD